MNQGRFGLPTISLNAIDLLHEVETCGQQAEVIFAAVPSGYRDIDIRIRARSTAASLTFPQLQFNGDTGSNYGYARSNRFGVDLQTTAAFVQLPEISNANSFDLPIRSVLHCTVSDYSCPTEKKGLHGFGGSVLPASSGNILSEQSTGVWKSTAAIHRIRVFLSNGSFANGSLVSFYGVR